LLPPVVLLMMLLALLPSDPAHGMTFSSSPYTDEAWNVVNARNLVLLGTWSTDEWNLHLLTLPFSLSAAAIFQIFGVGILQVRAMAIVCSLLALAFLVLTVRGQFGRAAAFVAGAGIGGSALLLYYGRLVYLETMVLLFLTAAAWALVRAVVRGSIAWGAMAGVLMAAAVLTKVSTAFAVAGLLAGAAVVAWRGRDGGLRIVAAAAASCALVGAAWLLIVALPRWDRVLIDLRIWPDQLSSTKPVWELVTSYFTGSDNGIPLLWPLLVAASIGVVLSVRAWDRLGNGQRLVVGAATGWFLVGMALLLVVPYRPNRYLVPLLPALAILAASGVARSMDQLPAGSRLARVLVPAVISAGLIIPGLVSYAGWLGQGQSRLPQIQRMTEAAVPPGASVQGDLAALFAMRVPATVIVQRRGQLNDADLYDTHHVRWVLTSGTPPRWAPLHPQAWSNRQTVFCTEWGLSRRCLVHVP
jgi:4-amino-4-deoxy-L-arabinose transferase-like glycosyltransferase